MVKNELLEHHIFTIYKIPHETILCIMIINSWNLEEFLEDFDKKETKLILPYLED